MTLNVFGTDFTTKEIMKGVGGTATVGIASATLVSQTKTNATANNLSKLQARSIIRRDVAEGHMTPKQAVEYCKQQEISPEECLNPLIYKSKPKQRGEGSTQLRGGGSSMDSSSDANTSSLQDGTNDVQEYPVYFHDGTLYVKRDSYSLQDGTNNVVEPVKNDTFIGVDPNPSVPYGHTGNIFRRQPYLPFILSGAFFVGYFTFHWFRKQKGWVRDFFPNETEIIIENQIQIQHKLDKISALQEKMNKNLLNEKTK